MTPTAKMEAALATLRWRLEPKRVQVPPLMEEQPLCQVRLDRLGFNAVEVQLDAIAEIPGFHRESDHFLRRREPDDFLPYGRVTTFTSTTSVKEMSVLSDKRLPRLANYQATMIAADLPGMQLEDVAAVFELVSHPQLTAAEIAWDFGAGSGVDGWYVRQHALFGKSRRGRVADERNWDCWGSRKGRQKFVRSYWKPEINAHRLEILVLARLLQKLRITEIFHFHRLRRLLPHHLQFLKLNEEKIIHRLRKNGLSRTKTMHVMRALDDHWNDLYAQCVVLHRKAHMTNIRRVLDPLPENRLLKTALLLWLTKWPSAPARLGRND